MQMNGSSDMTLGASSCWGELGILHTQKTELSPSCPPLFCSNIVDFVIFMQFLVILSTLCSLLVDPIGKPDSGGRREWLNFLSPHSCVGGIWRHCKSLESFEFSTS